MTLELFAKITEKNLPVDQEQFRWLVSLNKNHVSKQDFNHLKKDIFLDLYFKSFKVF